MSANEQTNGKLLAAAEGASNVQFRQVIKWYSDECSDLSDDVQILIAL